MKNYTMQISLCFNDDQSKGIRFHVKANDDQEAIEKALAYIDSPVFYHCNDIDNDSLKIISSINE